MGISRNPLRTRLWVGFLALFGRPLEVRQSFRRRQSLALRWVLPSLVVGIVVGAAIAAFEFLLNDELVWSLYALKSPLLYVLLPMAGLVAASLVTRFAVPGREGALTEDYILVYHDRARHMNWRNLPGKLVASMATIATGGSMGLEGPAVYLGANLGDTFQRRLRSLFPDEDPKMFMVAGCAAGMAAIFKAPLTGVIFAVEAPYKDGLASRRLVPSLVASAASYVTFVLLAGNEPLFSPGGHRGLSVVDLMLSVLLGACCGLGARLFVGLMAAAKRLADALPGWVRPIAAGLLVGGLGVLVFSATSEPYIYGPGYRLIRHLLEVQEPLSLLVFLFVAKGVATALTAAGGGVGGIFFPMAAMGAVMGAGFNHFVAEPQGSLYPIIGTAAFVGAGYRTPLAAVAFVAETMGNPWALIPAMLAAVVSLVMMGKAGVSDHQRSLPELGRS
jgi:chloride channel protein, CIC family